MQFRMNMKCGIWLKTFRVYTAIFLILIPFYINEYFDKALIVRFPQFLRIYSSHRQLFHFVQIFHGFEDPKIKIVAAELFIYVLFH